MLVHIHTFQQAVLALLHPDLQQRVLRHRAKGGGQGPGQRAAVSESADPLVLHILRQEQGKPVIEVRQVHDLHSLPAWLYPGGHVPHGQPGNGRIILHGHGIPLFLRLQGHAPGPVSRKIQIEGVQVRLPVDFLVGQGLLEEGKVRIRLVPLRADGQGGVPEEVTLSVLKADGSRHALGGGQIPLQHRDVPVHLVPAAVDCQVGPDQQGQGQDQEGGHGRQRPLSHGSSPSSPSASWSRVRRTRSAR